jgi:hypothetical protein
MPTSTGVMITSGMPDGGAYLSGVSVNVGGEDEGEDDDDDDDDDDDEEEGE